MSAHLNPLPSDRDILSDTELQILQSLQDIKYGSVEILIHDSRIVQIERSEKFRFDTKPSR